MLDLTDVLTIDESTRLQTLESTVTLTIGSFVQCAAALMEIRDSRLYRESHATFADYCVERHGITDGRARQLIRGAEVVTEVTGTIVPLGQSAPSIPPPSLESHARALGRLPKGERAPAWREAVETAPGGKVTAEHVKAVVNGRKPEAEPEDEPPISHALVEELEQLVKENERLLAQIQALSTDDKGAEIVRLSDILGRTQGLLEQAQATRSVAEAQARSAENLLAKIRKALGVANNGGILAAIEETRAVVADLRR